MNLQLYFYQQQIYPRLLFSLKSSTEPSDVTLTSEIGFKAAAAKSPEMGVAAMAVSMVIVPLVSAFTKNKDTERVEEIFTCYDED